MDSNNKNFVYILLIRENVSVAFWYFFTNLLGNWVLRRAKAHMPVCEYLRDVIIKKGRVSKEKIFPIGLPVDFEKYKFNQESINGIKSNYGVLGKNILITLTNFNYSEKIEAIDHFMPPVNRILEEYKDCVYLICGGGMYLEEFKKKIESKYKNDRIFFLGLVKPIEEIYTISDIVLYFTFFDALPNVLIEAQAASKPVIANDFAGTIEIVEHEKDGYIISQSNMDEVYDKIKKLLDDQDARTAMGKNGHENATGKYIDSTIGKNFLNIIRGDNSG